MLTTVLAPIAALLFSVSLLLMGNGLQSTLVPVRANMEAFSSIDLGLLGTAYFLGFTFGCVHGPLLIQRSGHIRAYLAMTSLASVVALTQALYVDPVSWWALRALTGYCFAVLYIVIESWLNARSDNQTRGLVFSIYTAINLTVITVGQMMLALADPRTFSLFAFTAILVSLAALPIAFTGSASPEQPEFVKPRIGKLFRISPVAAAGCFAVGLANGAFWALGPVFAQNEGFDISEIAYFMSAVVLGGAVAQWPLGTLSDRMDRRLVMLGAAIIAMLAAVVLMLMPSADKLSLVLVGAMFGAGAFPLYALAVAHANDCVEEKESVEVSSGLLLLYGMGAAVGPLLAAVWRDMFNAPSLFYFTAAVHVVLACYVVWRMSRRQAPEAEHRVHFSEAAIVAQTVFPIEPHSVSASAADDDVEADTQQRI
ncbi:MAG TPA: MFS transporter [Hyphomicrobium sp.]|nr:MFS transporter [Hyphomicrobium sp.]